MKKYRSFDEPICDYPRLSQTNIFPFLVKSNRKRSTWKFSSFERKVFNKIKSLSLRQKKKRNENLFACELLPKRIQALLPFPTHKVRRPCVIEKIPIQYISIQMGIKWCDSSPTRLARCTQYLQTSRHTIWRFKSNKLIEYKWNKRYLYE